MIWNDISEERGVRMDVEKETDGVQVVQWKRIDFHLVVNSIICSIGNILRSFPGL